MMKRTAVIMAGGSGERFYPLSRRVRPKQLLALVHEHKTMIEEAIERVESIIESADIYIITSVVLQPFIRRLLKNIPPENIVAEPYKRNTAPCLALAAALIAKKYEQDYAANSISIAVLTADQFIADVETFRKQVVQALGYAEQHEDFVTLGIQPIRPETGYGYIEVADIVADDIHKVKSFHEKPDAATAEQFLSSGKFLWNSGMFFYRCDTFLKGLAQHAPEISQLSNQMSATLGDEIHAATNGSYTSIDAIFQQMPDVSVDYALMERATNVCVLPSAFRWDDVGSWDSLDRTNEHDSSGNVSIGLTTIIESTNSIIANYSNDNSMMLSIIGLDNIVVVATDDSIVVCPKDRVQEVKKAVNSMKQNHQDKWL